MKLLLDENIPQDLRHFLPGHDVCTVGYLGWSGVENGALLALAAGRGFDALISVDRGLGYRYVAASLPIAVVSLRCKSNALPALLERVPALLSAVQTVSPRSIVTIS